MRAIDFVAHSTGDKVDEDRYKNMFIHLIYSPESDAWA